MSNPVTSPFGNPLSFASCSIGLQRHTLEQKLQAISSAGFNGIELSFPDLKSFANRHLNKEVADDDYPSLCEAGKILRKLCEKMQLQIMVLQPFSNFEGWPKGSQEREDAFKRAKGWMEIMSAVGTDMLQVGSSDSPDITASISELVADLAELADLLATRGFKVAYENWCWATHAASWKDVWKIVQLANRPNLGLCLDTFQSAGGEWGDPTTESGRIETGGLGEKELKLTYEISLQELAKTVPPEKIFFLQISDAYKVSPPLDAKPDESGLRPRGRWSHDYRPLPYDGGYLPILQFLEAVMSTGFRGWLSIEVFDGKFEEKYGDDLERYANKGREAVVKMLGAMIVDRSGF
ncbi:3-dehydroshikimate dehydratase [Colletotrichum truncatum]|uniref:3-dehydroshikimate dehydratase n=1 Tax=Colletotrichum truncatum TaxID=5467 RepID=A0ACC3YJT9_COLTU|nr:3-dehydroshikimate dehydratase [Colletotrichum truncatum]KAF6797404.1 3-dehydroshikimate dehydratase [Colletotrichum truncatum]